MATATKSPPHKHEQLRPGQVCGHCSLRAPPVHRCGMCRREVPDWPSDEIGHLEQRGWTLEAGLWVEPEERVMRSPTPEMVAEAMNLVAARESQLANQPKEYWRNDKGMAEQLRDGLEKARKRLASLQAGERFACRPRQRLSQQNAVQMEYIRTHDYEPRTKDTQQRTYTDEQLERWEREARQRRGGVLLESDQDILSERRERTLTMHRSMCSECRQY